MTPHEAPHNDDDFENTPVDEINQGRNPDDAIADVEQAKRQLSNAAEQARVNRLNSDNQRMSHLFWFVVVLVGFVMCSVYGIFIAFMVSQWGHIPSEAIIALITGTVIEVVGVLAVITKYLYRIDRDQADQSD